MISFRYHLVSVVAVFLALALGIVIGTTALNGPVTKDLRNQLNDTKQQRDDLAARVKTLQGQVDDAGEFASTYGSELVKGTLAGKTVLLISLPGATSGMQTGLTREIDAAGGKIGGLVTLTSSYVDPRLSGDVQNLAETVHPIGLQLPVTSDAGQLGGALLAYVLLGKGQKTDLTQVLGGFSTFHMVSLDSSAITPSNLVIVLGHGSLPAKQYAAGTEASLVSALAGVGSPAGTGGHVVLAGDGGSATAGGVVASVRGGAATRGAMSTVDDADSPLGQVSTVLAMSGAAAGQLGHYGTAPGAEALFPTPTK